MADINETVYRVKYEPDKESLKSLGEAAKGTIEKSLGKAKPNIDIKIATKSIDTATQAVDKLYDRFRALPNATSAMEKNMGRAFDKIAKSQERLEKGVLNPQQFQKMANQNLNYVNNMLGKTEKAIKGLNFFGENPQEKINRYLQSGLMKAPPIKIDSVDTSGAEEKLVSSFDKIGQLAALAFVAHFSKKLLQKIFSQGSEMQDLQLNLQGLFGLEEGIQAMDAFRDIAKELPGDLDDMLKGFLSLQNRGIKPTQQEFKDLVTFATSQGKDIDNLSLALAGAQTEQFMRLRNYGITIEKSGNKLIANFRGQRTVLERNSDAVTKYVASLGKLPDIIGTTNLKMNSLKGLQEKVNESLDNMKLYVYQAFERVLIPIVKKVLEVVEAIEEWVQANPELSRRIVELTVAIGGAITATLALSVAAKALAVVISPMGVVITAIAVALWDLWNGMTGGESVILNFLDSLAFWHDSNQEILDDIRIIGGEIERVSELTEEEISGRMVPSWISGWSDMLTTAANALNSILAMSTITSGGIASMFISEIPKGGGGFAGLARAAGAVFDKIALAAVKLINFLIEKFNALNQKIADTFSGIPIIGDMIKANANNTEFILNTFKSGLDSVGNSINGSILDRDFADAQDRKGALRNTEQTLADLTPGSVNSILNKVDQADFIPLNKDSNGNPTMVKETRRPYGYETIPGTNTPTSNQLKRDRWDAAVADMVGRGNTPTIPVFDPFKGMGGLTGSAPTGGGKGKNAGKKKGSGEDKDAVDKATIVAIEGIEDVLKKMGYSLTREIERADLFGAQKKAITEMLTSKDKTGVMDVFNTTRSGMSGDITNNNSKPTTNIFMSNGQRVDSNKLQIKSSSTLNDIWNVGTKVNGG